MRNAGTRGQEGQRSAASSVRQELRAAAREYGETAGRLLAAGPLVRGTLRWETRGAQRYAGLIRSENGKSVGRSVREEDLAWLEPMVAALQQYRQTQRRLTLLHRQVREAGERLRVALTREYEQMRELHRSNGHGA